jgi:hypothetical protein
VEGGLFLELKGLLYAIYEIELGMDTQDEEATKKQPKRGIRRFFLNFGKLILDATKLIFASLVLGTVIKGDIPQATLLVSGIIASGAGAIVGLILLTVFEEK